MGSTVTTSLVSSVFVTVFAVGGVLLIEVLMGFDGGR
jgi:hypothetical protein